MKLTFILCLMIFSTYLSFAQNESAAVKLNDSVFIQDQKLMIFKRNTQKDWNFKFKDSRMIISCKDSVWLLFYNVANISITDTSEIKFNDSSYIKQNGKRILPEMSFRFEKKWSKKKKSEAAKFNQNLYREIIDLKKKYHLEHLQEWHKWGESGFIGATAQDEANINSYFKEKKTLEAKRINIPSCASSHYSIFMENPNWVNPLPYMIPKYFPKEKVSSIDQLVEDLLFIHGGEED